MKLFGFVHGAIIFLSLLAVTTNRCWALDLYAFGSYWDVNDADGTWGSGVGVSLPLFIDNLRLDGRVYAFENSEINDDEDIDLLPLDLGLQFHVLPDSLFDPYLLGGVSYVYADSDGFDVDSELGMYVGGGVEYGMFRNLGLFAEIMYRYAELDGDKIIDGDNQISQDVDVSGVTANIGIKFSF